MKQKDKWQIKPIIKFSWVSDAINYNDSQDDVYCDSVFSVSFPFTFFVENFIPFTALFILSTVFITWLERTSLDR